MEVEFCDETFFPDEKIPHTKPVIHLYDTSIACLRYLLTVLIHIHAHRENETRPCSYLHLSRYYPHLIQFKTAQPANSIPKKTVSKQDYPYTKMTSIPILGPVPIPVLTAAQWDITSEWRCCSSYFQRALSCLFSLPWCSFLLCAAGRSRVWFFDLRRYLSYSYWLELLLVGFGGRIGWQRGVF